jgi:hypothetical protein
MKVTKRQLRRIIKEEKTRVSKGHRRQLLRESIADMVDFENLTTSAAESISNLFEEEMGAAWQDDPAMYADHSTEEQWLDQTAMAASDLNDRIITAINKEIGAVEMMLDDGQYFRG